MTGYVVKVRSCKFGRNRNEKVVMTAAGECLWFFLCEFVRTYGDVRRIEMYGIVR